MKYGRGLGEEGQKFKARTWGVRKIPRLSPTPPKNPQFQIKVQPLTHSPLPLPLPSTPSPLTMLGIQCWGVLPPGRLSHPILGQSH